MADRKLCCRERQLKGCRKHKVLKGSGTFGNMYESTLGRLFLFAWREKLGGGHFVLFFSLECENRGQSTNVGHRRQTRVGVLGHRSPV